MYTALCRGFLNVMRTFLGMLLLFGPIKHNAYPFLTTRQLRKSFSSLIPSFICENKQVDTNQDG